MKKILICDRCRKPITTYHKVSYFNTQTICEDCDIEERNHPDFEYARDVEIQEVLNGNRNFEGIGLPEDLRRKYNG